MWTFGHDIDERENDMLTLTDTAADIVKQISDQVPDADASGLRISTSEQGAEVGLTLTPVAVPEPGDQVLDEHGARVFLDETAAAILDDKVLDAQVQPDGAVAFDVAQQG